MKVTKKKLEDGKLQLEAVATAEEVNRALHQASIAFAQQMGLHPEKDKTIAQIAEEKMGVKDLDSIVESQALEALVPFAIDKKNIIPAYPPKPQAQSAMKRGHEFKFKLTVAPKPDYELSSYDPVTITVPPFEVDESLIDQQISQMAEQYAEYVADDPRPVEKGDSCMVALECYENGKKMEGLSTEGRTYTTGGGFMPDGFDENIIGMKPGETKTFTFEGPGLDDDGNETTETVECTATVKEIQKKVIPVINDEWVAKNMPLFRDMAALRGSMMDQMSRQGKQQYDDYVRQVAASELARRFQGRIADEVYESMQQNLMNNLRMQLQQQGMTYEQFVEQQGGQQQFSMMMMMQTREMLIQGYALDALFRYEKMVLSDEDITAACRAMNPQQNPKMVRQQMEQNGRGFALRETAERLKANKWLVEHATVNVVDPKAQVAKTEESAKGEEAAKVEEAAKPAKAKAEGAEATENSAESKDAKAPEAALKVEEKAE